MVASTNTKVCYGSYRSPWRIQVYYAGDMVYCGGNKVRDGVLSLIPIPSRPCDIPSSPIAPCQYQICGDVQGESIRTWRPECGVKKVLSKGVARIWDTCCSRFGPVLACSGSLRAATTCSGSHSHKLKFESGKAIWWGQFSPKRILVLENGHPRDCLCMGFNISR
jgi:hypothetical protein